MIIKSDYIKEQLTYLHSKVFLDNGQSLYDINKTCEDVFMHLLNSTYGWSLKNANLIQENFPAIDLIDEKNELVIQVTSTIDAKKLADTIKKFKALDGYQHYQLKIFYIKDKPKFQKKSLANFAENGVTKEDLLDAKAILDKVSSDTDSCNNVYDTLIKIIDNKNITSKKITNQLTTTLGISKNFIGREKQLKIINEKLSISSSLLLINGIGGVGKSAIASHYLQNKKDKLDYYGFFSGLHSFFSELKVSLDIKAEKYDEAFIETLWKLRELKGSKLLVIDDITEIEEQKEIIGKILALKEHGYQILLTSREEIDEDVVASFYLDVLDLADAKMLFNTIYLVDDDLLLEDILDYLGCHTFFVKKTAETLKNKKTVTLQALKEKFENGEFSKISVKRRKSFGKYLNQLFNFEQLDNEEILVLTQLAALPAIEVKFDILQNIFNPEDNEIFEEILNHLSEKGWLNASDDSYKLHQIIKEFILDNHKADFDEAILPLVKNVSVIENKIERTPPIMVDVMASLLATYPEEKCEDIGFLSNNLACIYLHLAEYNKSQILLENALSISEKLPSEHHLDIMATYENLAYCHTLQGFYDKALPIYEKTTETNEKKLGEWHYRTANSYSNFAFFYYSQGNYLAALPLYEKALVIFKKDAGENGLATANAYDSLAICYKCLNKPTKILCYHEKALLIREQLSGKKGIDTAFSYNNIGEYYRSQGKYNKAILFAKKALSIREKVLGDHPDTAESYNNLALAYEALKKYTNALSLHEKTLEIKKKRLGETHPETALSYNNIAFLHFTLRNCKKALYYAEKSLFIYKSYDFKKDIFEGEKLLKTIKKQIRKAKKHPLKKRRKICKDL